MVPTPSASHRTPPGDGDFGVLLRGPPPEGFRPAPAAGALAPGELVAYLGPASLDLAVGDARGRLVQPEARSDARHVRHPVGLVLEAELGHDPLAVFGGEQQCDRLDFAEQVE